MTDLPAFRASLLAAESDLVSEEGELLLASSYVKHTPDKCVFILRFESSLMPELSAFAMTLVGEAKHKYIQSNGDVNWIDEHLYRSIHSIEPITFTDDEGIQQTVTPPKITRSAISMTINYDMNGVVPTNQGVVDEPVNVLPANGATVPTLFPTLTASAYAVVGGDNPEEWGRFQLFYDAGLTNLAYDSGLVPSAISHKVTEALDELTTYYYRTNRKGAQTTITPFSQVTSFTTSFALSEYVSINRDTGNGVALTVTTGVDLSANDGTIWIANRDNTEDGKKYTASEALLGEDIFTSGALVADPRCINRLYVHRLSSRRRHTSQRRG